MPDSTIQGVPKKRWEKSGYSQTHIHSESIKELEFDKKSIF